MERLSKGCAVGVPFSALGLAVKARKDTPRKGRPQKNFLVVKVWQRPASKQITQRERACENPKMGLLLGWPLSSF
jgi:hypothetical protein